MDGQNNGLLERLKEYGADTVGAMNRMMDDIEFYEHCLRTFLADPCFENLGNALNSKDYTHAFEEAHSLKGVTGNLGLTPMYQIVCEIVEPLRNKQCEGLDEKYDSLMRDKEKLSALL